MTAIQNATESDVYAVILAGGSGTRFWPKSRHLSPKQLCSIGGAQETMIEITLARLDDFVPPERRVIVTHKDQLAETRRIVGKRCAVILPEPEARNTANALALAALHIETMAKSASASLKAPVMLSLHADHIIKNLNAFKSSIHTAIQLARQGSLSLLGIVPSYAETGYGYIERGDAVPGIPHGYKVKSFREKPELTLAQQYVASGQFYWNAGLFVWRTDAILEELHQRLPATIQALKGLLGNSDRGFDQVSATALAEVYSKLPKISIDHAVLEVSKNVTVVDAPIDWQDVGSWDALDRCFAADEHGNLLIGDGVLLESKGTTLDSDGPFIAGIGLRDFVVVAAKGAILVCPKSQAQDVKKIVDWLHARGRKELI